MAPSPHQIAGALLEEAVLAIFRSAGFSTLDRLRGDPTIDPNGPPVTIRGRGTDHQIDAVADPLIAYPFSNPTRLLVEAKAYSDRRRVGLDVVRNAVGTLKDISEFWSPRRQGPRRMRRYHYRYAIFATTQFTKGAQEYAFAHDVYLLPLRGSAFFRPVVDAIDQLREFYHQHLELLGNEQSLWRYRILLRNRLRLEPNYTRPGDRDELTDLVEAVWRVRFGLIAVAVGQFPIFLVPRDPHVIDDLHDTEFVEIYWDDAGWYLRRRWEREALFSFDLPLELFSLYASGGVLKPVQALRLKAEGLGHLQAFVTRGQRVRLVQFLLDDNWIQALLRRHGG